MIRCKRCIMPNTRPDIRFDDEGICSACRAYELRPRIDWAAREIQFRELMKQHKTHPAYDCVVASSGGKDSHYIAIKVRELGYRPLIVTATTDFPTELGRRNLANLIALGFDTVQFTPNPIVRRKLNRIGLERIGDIEWPEHCLIFSTPIRIAEEMGIGIVLYGENSQNEYSGGPQDAVRLDKRWREEYGGLLGLRPKDLIGIEGLSTADLWPYNWPDGDTQVFGLFLGQFYEWDGWRNALVAQAHGFEVYPHLVEGNLSDYENLDNAIIGLHDWFGFLKFGFSRATVMASLHVRRGRLTRDEAIALATRMERRPDFYLGTSLCEITEVIGLPWVEYLATEDRFANTELLIKTDGMWCLKESIS